MLVDVECVRLARYFLEGVTPAAAAMTVDIDADELRMSLAEAIQQAIEEWYRDLTDATILPEHSADPLATAIPITPQIVDGEPSKRAAIWGPDLLRTDRLKDYEP